MLGYDELLTETCSYERFIDTNKYNEKSYTVPREVDCFTSFDFSNVVNYEQQNVTLHKRVFIGNDFTPHPFDKVDGFEIKQIKPVKGLVTPIMGWEIVL